MNGLLRDVILPNGQRGDLRVVGGRVAALEPAPATSAPRIVLPSLTEAHCHLDKCHSLHRLGNVGGDLRAAIAVQAADKAQWTAQDLLDRGARGLEDLIRAGCGLVRSHVDWGDEAAPPLAWSVLTDLAQARAADVTLTLSALVNVAQIADPGFARDVAQTIARTGGALGTFILDQPELDAGLVQIFRVADSHGLALDFHVDEGLQPGLRGVEAIADAALHHGFQGPILCGHACGLMNLHGDDFARLADKLARAGIFVAALPTTNLYLQGRGPGTPDRRGVTRLSELAAAGVRIVVGSDNVEDAFCPVGQHDPLAALHLAILSAHLDPPFDRWLPAITDHASAALGHPQVEVIGARLTDLRISPARSMAELISGRAGPPTPILHLEEAPS